MTELEYRIKHRGFRSKLLLRKVSRRGFGASLLGGLAGMAASHLPAFAASAGAESDFTIAIIPDPQFLAASCPDAHGGYYASMMNWIVANRAMLLTSGGRTFPANIKAVIGVGDCVDATTGVNEFANAQNAWSILDANGIPFITPPGNHDYTNGPSSRSNLGAQFASGYFSAASRASVYRSGIQMGGTDIATWIGSFDSTGANTAVKFVVSGIGMLIIAMDFFAGTAAWSWAYDVMMANADCECYITTHAWLTSNATAYQRTDGYGPDFYSMAAAPYSNSATEAWSSVGVSTWPNLCGIFSGHDIMGSQGTDPSETASAPWFWQHAPIRSESTRGQRVHQLYVNSQQIDAGCSHSVSTATGAGQIASVFLLTRRLGHRKLEGRMISTVTGDWFGPRAASFPGGTSWTASETLLFSVPFAGLKPLADPGSR